MNAVRHTINAEWGGTCTACWQRYEAGSSIRGKGGRYVHSDCPDYREQRPEYWEMYRRVYVDRPGRKAA